MEGFEGFVALGSRQSGKLQEVTFWESEEALRATDEAVAPIREGAAEFKVFVFEAPSAGPVATVTDTVGGATGNLLGGEEEKS